MPRSTLSPLVVLAIALGACASRSADVRTTAADPGAKSGSPRPRVGALAESFDSDKLAPEGQPAAAATVYACPMHPEVTSDKPGKCPKCGMDLEPKPGSNGRAAEQHEHHHGTP